MPDDSKEILAKALTELRRLKAENAALKQHAATPATEPIAIVGLACRFPGGCADPEAYWEFLAEGRSAIQRMPAERCEGRDGGFGSFLEDVDQFDAAFFGISPKEAQSLDPQQRLLLELAWHAFESGNIRADTLAGRDVGVFVGMSGIDYALKLFAPANRGRIDPYFGTGSTLSPAAGRLSYFFKLNGPSMVVDTACSSSLVAIHLAAESLRRGECEAALAAGVNRILGPDLTINFAQSGLLSPDGKCHTFDARAQGYSRGEGGGALVLKRLRDAEAAGDRIFALILGSAVNQDGGSGGLTVPSGPAQQKVIRRALQSAGVKPADVTYVETHGTATPLGDPIEANALGEVFREGRDATRPLEIGSVKTNFGHLEAAAGMASVFKVIQSLRHEAIPPHLNFSQPSSHIDWTAYPLRVVEALRPWPRGAGRRIASASGFGFAGTNAHLVFAEAPASGAAKTAVSGTASSPGERAEAVVLSAKSPEALRAQAAAFAERFATLAPADWAAAAATSQTGRVAMPERLSVVASTPAEAVSCLRNYHANGKARGVASGRAREKLRTAFVFTGQGAQYAGMGRRLYAAQPQFREVVDLCATKLQPLLGRDIREVMFAEVAAANDAAGPGDAEGSVLESTRNTAARSQIDETLFTQAGLFVIEVALARLWEAWGVKPDVVLGHSVGEYAAACVAGVFDLDDGLKLIAARGRLMQERSAAGAMLTVFADEPVVAEIVAPFAATASIAAVNGPGIVLVSGAEKTIATLQARFEQAELRVVRMRISHAFHSPLTEPVLDELRAVATTLTLRAPKIPLISNVTGEFAAEEVARPEYWVRHLRQSVRFCESMTLLHAQKLDYFVEIGPEPTLQGLDLCFRMIREQASSAAKWLPSLRRGHDDLRAMLDSASRCWCAGGAIDWAAVQAGRAVGRVSLPLYPYQRRRHWFDCAAPETLPDMPTDSAPTPTPIPAIEPPSARAEAKDLLSEVQAIIGEVSGLEPADLAREANLLEMGLDSLMFVRAGRTLEKRFQVNISMKQFYEELHRMGPLVDFLAAHGRMRPDAIQATSAAEATPPATLVRSEAAPAELSAAGGLDPVMQAHFRLMERYVESRKNSGAPARVAAPLDRRMAVNFAGVNLQEEKNLTPSQKEFLRALTERYVARTRRSKAQTQAWRRELADWKGSLQFKRSLKELKYPITCDRAEGARVWDIDGNEYVDFALGMGVHFLGHAPACINAALHRQIDRSAALGPQSELAGEVARKICQLTGVERVSLAVTGSGAVMLAQRLARAVTGRPLIAQFAGAYHGIGSEVLAVAGESGARPLSPGIPPSVVENSPVLDYGSEEALEWIRANASQLAAVMVEPVQSRRPGFQPHRFLRRLRRLTQELEIALIFDEMINGFRIHAGGAQAWFGIEADIVTYGKIVGGGLPLSAIAGKARYLDWIDGGFWQFGDDSAPSGQNIFTGGTHNRHPLALAAANAALDHMIAAGPALHEAVNRRTERLGRELNAFFEAERVALRAAWFGSQFRFEVLGDAFEAEVLFHLLIEQGFYTWEQRTCCVSTAHTEEDLERFIAAVRRAVEQMRAGGFALQAGPAAPRRVLPLSSVQERLFALCQRDGAEMPYHLSGIWEISGPVDAFKLQDAFQETIRRHESLRTAFTVIAGKPCQYVIDEPRFFLETLDAAGRTADALLQAFIRPFDLERPPLLRVGYAPLAPNRAWLAIDVHHIAADGLSMNVILQEFAALYDGAKLRPVKRQYRHVVDEMEQRRKSDAYAAQGAYWLQQLTGGIPMLDLPADFARAAERDFRGDKCTLKIAAERTRRLEAFGREHGASLTMVLLAAFSTLLHRLTEAEDVVIGLPVGGRPGADSDEAVGMFVNSLPLRFRPRGDAAFHAFLGEVRETCLGAYDNSEYAFGDLVARLDLPRGRDRNPVFDVMFAYENADDRAIRTRDLEIRTIDQFEGSGMFDFNVDIIREAGVLNIRLHYATQLFRRETIERWAEAFSRLLDAVVERPAEPLGRLPLLAPAELERVSVAFNETGPAFPAATLLSLWDASVRARPDAVALVCGERRMTYAEADAQAAIVAGALGQKHGVERGDYVALLLEANERMVVAILGVLKAGAAYVPIDPANPLERVKALVADSGARALVVDDASAWADAGANVVTMAALLASRATPVSRAVTASELAYVIYTSGSTGQPKGVLIEHGGIANSVQWRVQACAFTSADVTLQMPSFAFDASLLDVFAVLAAGGRLVLAGAAEKRDLAGQAARIRREGVTNLLLTPSLHALYLAEIGDAMAGLRFITVAGEATSVSLVRSHFERVPRVRLLNEYGPTENSVVTTFTELFAHDDLITIGRPVAGNRVFVVQPNGERCGVGVPGELVVAGPGLARGYLNRPEQTAAAFTAAPWEPARRIYRTGDRARWRADGTLEFLGRRDGQVKLRGLRIELEEIEDLLRRQPGVTAAAAAIAAIGGEPQLIGYVSVKPGYSETAVREAFRRMLPVHLMPSVIVQLPELPLNQSGKVDRRALPVPAALEPAAAGEPPRGRRELALAEVWSDVLRHAPIGRDDDYFRLGGDSIKGIQIISRLLQRGWRLDMRWLFRHPTIATLAPQLEATRAATTEEATEAGAEIPLTPMQSWFFRTCGAQPHHFNQAIWLDAKARWNVPALSAALRRVAAAHEAFRFVYQQSGDTWRQSRSAPAPRFDCRVLDLRGSAEAEMALAEMVRAEQASLHLERGPLSRAVIVQLDSGDRLFWTTHHAVVDGVSWRILLEDLAAAYAAEVAGRAVELPPRTSGVGQWTRAVRGMVSRGKLADETACWTKAVARALPALPGDSGVKTGTVASLATVTGTIANPKATRLLGEAHGAFRTRGIELFVAALRLAHAEWNPGQELALLLEGHGRETSLADIDVSRTVGWFTSVYPVRFETGPSACATLIRDTKEELRRVPRNGAGFGWLRDAGAMEASCAASMPEISFNFLGDLSATRAADGAFALSPERPAHSADPRLPVPQPIALFGHVLDGVLYWTLEYDGQRFAAATMRRLMDLFVRAIETIEAETRRFAAGMPSPADFACHRLTLDAFDRLVERREWAAQAIEDIYPLSPMQKGLYYETLKAPQSEAYFEQMSFRLEGGIDLPALERSWRALVKRHAALRSVLVEAEGHVEPLQVVFREIRWSIGRTELSAETEAKQDARIAEFQLQDRQTPFALGEGPLMRVHLFELGQGKVHVVWSHPHILMDGWCVGILYEDLIAAYIAETSGQAAHFEPPADYRGYIQWLDTCDKRAALDYWRAQLAGYETLATLPRMRPAAAGEHRCRQSRFTLEDAAWRELQATAAANGATTATLLQTLWGILLSRYNGATDVVFGAIVSGRPESVARVEEMVGLFINAVPVRLRFDEKTTLREALKRFQSEAIERRAHEHVPLAEITDQAPALRELFDHLVVLENYPMDEELRGDGGGAGGRPRISRIEAFERTHFDFTLVAVPRRGALEVELTYNEAVYSAEQIRRVESHFVQLVQTLAAQPTAPCVEVDWLPDAERRQLEQWNATAADYPRDATIVSLFEEQVARHAARPAVTSRGEHRSYSELDRAARQLATRLAADGVQPGDRVAIWLPRDGDMVVALLATLRVGACYVPLDPEYPDERLRFILGDSGARVVVAHPAHRSPFRDLREVLIDVAPVATTATNASVTPGVPHPNDAAYIIYTSGSTGKPKGCLISHRNVVRLLRNARFGFEFGPEDVWVVAHSFCFDFSVWELYGALLNGGRVVVAPREEVRDIRSFVDLVARERVTVLNQTPAAFYAFGEEALKRSHDFGAHLRYVIFGGDRLEPHYLAPWAKRFGVEAPALINMYGITETTVHVTFHRVTAREIDQPDGRSLIGAPLPETTTWVLDEKLRPLPIGVAGEIYVGGTGVGLGYLNRPELTAARFLPDPRRAGARLYRTGDVGRWREDGRLEYVGRNDHQVQVRGFRVELGEVEAACLRQPGVEKALVLPFEAPGGQLELVAYLVGVSRSAAELRATLAGALPQYMIPGYVEWLPAIPLTVNGKVDRKALPRPGATTRGEPAAAPRTRTEAALLRVWCEVLGVATAGIHDNFFDLGGQSLKAVRLRARIEDAFQVTIPLRDLFAHPTVAALAEVVAKNGEPAAAAVVDPELAALVATLSPEELEAQLRQLET